MRTILAIAVLIFVIYIALLALHVEASAVLGPEAVSNAPAEQQMVNMQ